MSLIFFKFLIKRKRVIQVATLYYLLLTYHPSFSQGVITGHISGAENNQPIAGASVFISNTSTGTTTNSNGDFSINTIPLGRHELVVSSVGYETFVKSFSETELPLQLNLKLKLKVRELDSVTVIPFEKDGWHKWGRLFIENFIGTDKNADDCQIENHEAIRFRFLKKENKLVAIAFEPLVIINKSLGYKIKYQLENFEIDFGGNSMIYLGYAFFDEMKGNARKWKKARQVCYNGSMMHFVRSICSNQLQEEGFEVRRLKKVFNNEKARVKEIYKVVPKRKKDEKTDKVITVMEYNYEVFPKDSVSYYDKVLAQKDFFDMIGDSILTADSIAGIDKDRIKYLAFHDYLDVVFRNGKEEVNYLIYTSQTNRKPSFQHSSVFLTGAGYVVLEISGSYFNPLDLHSTGYWAWKEKVASLLPYDYNPDK